MMEEDIRNEVNKHRMFVKPNKSAYETRWLYLIAIVLLMLALSVYFFTQKPEKPGPEYFAAYHSAWVNPNIRGGDVETEITRPCDQAHIALDQGNTDIALEKLTNCTTNEDTTCWQTCEWLYAMVYLKSDEITKAKEQLQIIVQNTTHEYYDKAVKLLDELD
jgi:hypothetical protein